MRAILMSDKPKWTHLVLNGYKLGEIRKSKPNCKLPITCFMYCSKNGSFERENNEVLRYNPYKCQKGKVVAKMTIYAIEEVKPHFTEIYHDYHTDTLSCAELLKKLSMDIITLDEYLKCKRGYLWYVRDVEIFDEPKDLSEFTTKVETDIKNGTTTLFYINKAPQSWCYVEI